MPRIDLDAVREAGSILRSPLRIALLWHLARRPADMSELAELLHISRPTVHRSLALLREKGLVVPVDPTANPWQKSIQFTVDRGALKNTLSVLGHLIP